MIEREKKKNPCKNQGKITEILFDQQCVSKKHNISLKNSSTQKKIE
ncbi:MAG: hypothetical protein P857_90 [Candidatus Xenolissoclinum pacificiensis L6]|uniref:Uncharacterized protein n=1 Tax=Candidatus Xenolissoclinum pacificiensis L6 TaxID=1401685 RepID=W2UYR3_9RICK|nr:MAG: hypothetical protein P857_90 [Candidatus Xenolissoclinum pacificiensis L6]